MLFHPDFGDCLKEYVEKNLDREIKSQTSGKVIRNQQERGKSRARKPGLEHMQYYKNLTPPPKVPSFSDSVYAIFSTSFSSGW